MVNKAKVVITDYAWASVDGERRILSDLAELAPLQTKTADEFLPHAADCDALLNAYAGPITAAVMAQMPKCKIIAKYGIGVDTIDIDAATAAGIIVTNNPNYCIEEVAEHTLALILASARKIAFYDRQVRSGAWAVPPGKPLYRLAGGTLGLVGFGNIARAVAVRAAAFGMRVLYCTPRPNEVHAGVPGTRVDWRDLLRASDVVSLHPPLTPATRHLMNDDAFACMKPTPTFADNTNAFKLNSGADITVRTRDSAGALVNLTNSSTVPAIVISHGKNGYGGTSESGTGMALPTGWPASFADENSNATGTTSFVSRPPQAPGASGTGGEFDDIVTWVPLYVLLNRMVTAGKLP